MTNYIESYKVISGRTPQRRETLKGALALAEKLHKHGRHGEVQEVWVTNNGIEFKTIRKF